MSPLFLVLLLVSELFCLVAYMAGVYGPVPELVSFAMFYGVILPFTWLLFTGIKYLLLCRAQDGWLAGGRLKACPPPLFRTCRVLPTVVLSYSLMVIAVVAVAFLAGVEVRVRPQLVGPASLAFLVLQQLTVGTMEEAVFRQAIPETLALLGGHPLLYAFLTALLFGLLHLWAYGSVFLCVSAIVVGVVNALIYFGYLGEFGAGCIEGLAIAHALYNITVTLLSTSAILAFVLPACVVAALALLYISPRLPYY